MEYLIIPIAAFLTAGLTLFSGFGLGTLLLPVFAIFFPVETAVAATAVVHFLNNLFKLGLFRRSIDRSILLQFGLPALAAAFVGAQLLIHLSSLEPIWVYSLGTKYFTITPIKISIAILMIWFAAMDVIPRFQNLTFERKYLPLGGLASGFIGGLSGHQGALRSAFLVKCGLTRDVFIGTGVAIACAVDISRISVYSFGLSMANLNSNLAILIAATIAAFSGSWIGNRIVKRVTIRTVQWMVTAMLCVIAIGLGLGLI